MGRPRQVSDEEILAATARVVGRSGLAGLTLRDVADEVGVTASSIVQRFGSKHRLLVAMATGAAAGVDEAVRRARAEAADPLDAIRRLVRALVVDVHGREHLVHHLTLLQLDLVDPELRVHAVAHHRRLRAGLRACVADAVRDGLLDVPDPGRLADLLVTVYDGALLTWALDGRGSVGSWVESRFELTLAPWRTD